MMKSPARSCAALACLALLALPPALCAAEDKPAAPAPSVPGTNPGPTKVAGLVFDVPGAFKPLDVQPGGMRAAQFILPAAKDAPKGAESAELVFYYFGPQGAGDVDANIARWASQVTDAKGEPVIPKVTTREAGSLKITEAALEGTYLSGMPGGEKTPKEGFALLGAIVERGPQGMVVVKMTGPKVAMDANRALWDGIMKSVRVDAK